MQIYYKTDMIIQTVGEKNLENFFKAGKIASFSKGDVILRPDDTPDYIYFVEDGFVKVYWISENGDEKLHVIYQPGDAFPLMWAINDVPAGGYYEAMSDTVLRKVQKNLFTQFIRSDSDALFAMTTKLATTFNIYVHMLDNLGISKSYPRLISRLLFLAKRFGRHEKEGVVLEVPITEKDIASSIALTRETVSREMNALRKKELINKKNKKIVIPDLKKLEVELSENYEGNSLIFTS